MSAEGNAAAPGDASPASSVPAGRIGARRGRCRTRGADDAASGRPAGARSRAEAVLAGLDERAADRRPGGAPGRSASSPAPAPGKTRTITHRIAYGVHTGVYVPEQVLAVTFTARAAGELRGRLSALDVGGVQARTFHAAAMRQLRYFAPAGARRPDARAGREQAAAGGHRRVPHRGCPPTAPACATSPARSSGRRRRWPRRRTTRRGPRPPAGSRRSRPPRWPRSTPATSRPSSATASLDFEDLLLVTAYALEEHRDVAREVRGQYRHFVVDEYQDVNPLQQRLLDAWLGGRAEVCVVGDPNQTIYSFTGADPDYLLGFADRYPDAEVVKLERDYRSTPQVVGLANRLIGQAPRRKGLPGLRLLGQRADGPEPTLRRAPRRAGRGRRGRRARAGRSSTAGMPAAEIAVLFRINAQSQVYESALADVGVPVRAQGRRAVLRAARGPGGGAAAARRGGRRAASPARWCPTVRDVLASTGLGRAPAAAGRRGARPLAVAGRAGRPRRRPGGREPDAGPRRASSRTWPSGPNAQHAPTVQGVTLASMHAAKGLEWDVVFVVGLVDGVVPIAQSLARPGGGRGGAPAALRRGHPRPRAADAVLVAGPQPRRQAGPAAQPLPRPGSRPTPARPRRRPAGRPRSRRSCSRARRGSCSSGCGRGGARRRSRRRCRPTSSSPTPRCRRSRRPGPANLRELSGAARHRRPQARAVRRRRARDRHRLTTAGPAADGVRGLGSRHRPEDVAVNSLTAAPAECP